jgi:putative peptidoglycan lipid II flippase
MNQIVPKKRRLSLTNTALLLVVTAFMSQMLGFLRTKLVNGNFPVSGAGSRGAYFAAFTIPDFFFYTLAAGALGVAFMPVLADRLHKGDRKGIWDLSSSLMNLLAIVMAIVGVAIFVFAEPLVKHVVGPGLTAPQIHNAVVIMRFLAFNPLLFTISGIFNGLQQTLGRFFFYAVAPLFYNLSIIISAIVFSTNPGHDGGPWHLGLAGLGFGAMVGAVLQLIVVIIGLLKTHFRYKPKILWRNPDFRVILHQLPPRSLDQGMDQVENIVETNIASRIGGGADVTYYNNAFLLYSAPVMLIGTAISTAAFPRLNQRLSQGRPDLFRSDFLRILRILIWIAMPVVVISYFARGYLARLIFTTDSPQVSLIFGYLTVAIFFRITYALVSRWFYSQKDTKTPLFVSVFTVGLNVVLAYSLTRRNSYGIAGLGLAQSIVAAVEVAILGVIMLVRDHKLFNAAFWGGVAKILSVTGFSMIAGLVAVSVFPLGASDRGIVTLGAKLLVITTVVFVVHIVMSGLFGLEEVRPLLDRAKRLILKPIKLDF